MIDNAGDKAKIPKDIRRVFEKKALFSGTLLANFQRTLF
jgi:hypothetical protein